MSINYANPPLIEALCQFQFQPGKPWDFTIPGLLFARVRDEFPDTHVQPGFHVNFELGQVMPPQVQANAGLMQFRRRDRTALLQLMPDALVVNQLPKYPHWEAFRDLILLNLDHYVEVAQPKGILQMQLRYINRIDVPSSLDLHELTRYCTAVPGVPDSLTRSVDVRFSQRVEISLPEARGILVLQSGVIPSEVTGHSGLLLDLEFASAFPNPVPLQAAAEWIERAHAEVERAFLECYTQNAKDTFGGTNHD